MELEDKIVIWVSIFHICVVLWNIFISLIALIIGSFSMTNFMCVFFSCVCAGVWFYIVRGKFPEYKKMFITYIHELINETYQEIQNERNTDGS